jgi:hypothetical protein
LPKNRCGQNWGFAPNGMVEYWNIGKMGLIYGDIGQMAKFIFTLKFYIDNFF